MKKLIFFFIIEHCLIGMIFFIKTRPNYIDESNIPITPSMEYTFDETKEVELTIKAIHGDPNSAYRLMLRYSPISKNDQITSAFWRNIFENNGGIYKK